jgi:hypothetical protein
LALTLSGAIWGTAFSLANSPEGRSHGNAYSPVFRLNLRALGFPEKPSLSHSRGKPIEKVVIPLAIDPICFPSDGTVVVTFVTENTPSALTNRGAPGAFPPFQLHAIFVDTKTGQVQATRDWATTTSESRVLPGTNGNFIVLAPNELILYSPQMEILGRLNLSLSKCDAWEVRQSPGRKALLVTCFPVWQEELSKYEWIDAEHLQVIREWTVHGLDTVLGRPTVEADAISDGEIVSGNAIRNLGGSWRHIINPAYLPPFQNEFVNNDTLLSYQTWGKDQFLSLIRTDGQLLYKQDVPPSEQFSHGPGQARAARPSADGNRFALPFYKGHGGSSLLDIPGHYLLKELMVYDLPGRRWIFRLDGKKQGIRTLSGLALSPDGSLMGLITQDGILEVYRLPKR